MYAERTNVVVVHGGGLVDPSKDVILRIASNLYDAGTYFKVYCAKYSFEALYNPQFLMEYSPEFKEECKAKRGTFFGTCRDIDLTDKDLAYKTIHRLLSKNIRTIIVAGGDGSSRQVAEIADFFRDKGINIIFPIPLTLDGINGGWSVGIDQAVRESVRQIENCCATSLETRNGEKFGVVMAELQGRDRDDILARVLREFWRKQKVADCDLSRICIFAVPKNYPIDKAAMIEKIKETDERTLVLLSEGADTKISELSEAVKPRKTRSLVVGHASQSNGLTTEEDIQKISEWIDDACLMIAEDPRGTYCIAYDGVACYKAEIDYYARLNPQKGSVPFLSTGLEWMIKKFSAN